jgi:hypothetical protein
MRRTPAVAVALAAAALLSAGCGKKSERERAEEKSAKSIAPVGVLPFAFKCDSLAPAADLASLLGGTIEPQENLNEPPQGTPGACNYLVTSEAGQQAWIYDVDCRSSALEQADILFAQYEEKNRKLVEGYAAASAADAGVPVKKPEKVAGAPEVDAGPPPPPPTASKVVAVGKRGLDEGQGILFVDDDAPCHVRIVGPDPDRRLALAQLIAKNLTEATAPMDPKFRRTIPAPK